MPVRCLLLLLAFACATPASAQLTYEWAPREDANANLPESIRAFESTTAGSEAWYIRADLSDMDWEVVAALSDESTETVASFADDANALVAINGGYYSGGQSFSLVRQGGQTLVSNIAALNRSGVTFYPTRGAFGLDARRVPDVAWVYNVNGVERAYDVPNDNREGQTPPPQPDANAPAGSRTWNVSTAIGGGPVLVENGAVRLTWEEEVFFGGSGVDLTSSRARTAVGYDADGHMLLFVAAENPGLTLRQLAEVMIGIGAVEAVNLDGGGSSNMIAGGTDLYTTSRPVRSAFMIVGEGGGDGGGDGEGVVVDTGDAEYSETGGWFASANTPFYGKTPARLLQVGEEGRAVFAFDNLTEAGTYALQAWWVPGQNRATDTPYTIYTASGEQTVRVDQSDFDGSGVWNSLATVELAPGDSVVVTTEATVGSAATFVVVDAVRAVPLSTPSVEGRQAPSFGLRVSPNPASGVLSAALTLEQPSDVRVTLTDMLGRIVRETTARLGAGEGRVEMSVRGLAPGVYTLRAAASGAMGTARVTVVR